MMIFLFVFGLWCKSVLISFLKEYRRLCHVIDNIITMKDTFLGKFFHIWFEIQAMFDILIFLEIHKKMFCWNRKRKLCVPTGKSWTFSTFWNFDRRSSLNIDGAMAVLNLDLFGDLLMSPMSSVLICRGVVAITWYISTPSLITISCFVFSLSCKMCLFHSYGNI